MILDLARDLLEDSEVVFIELIANAILDVKKIGSLDTDSRWALVSPVQLNGYHMYASEKS